MRGNLMAWMALLAVAVGSASISWVRTDINNNGWMGIQLGNGNEVRIEFVDRDGSGTLNRLDPIGSTQVMHLN